MKIITSLDSTSFKGVQECKQFYKNKEMNKAKQVDVEKIDLKK